MSFCLFDYRLRDLIKNASTCPQRIWKIVWNYMQKNYRSLLNFGGVGRLTPFCWFFLALAPELSSKASYYFFQFFLLLLPELTGFFKGDRWFRHFWQIFRSWVHIWESFFFHKLFEKWSAALIRKIGKVLPNIPIYIIIINGKI